MMSKSIDFQLMQLIRHVYSVFAALQLSGPIWCKMKVNVIDLIWYLAFWEDSGGTSKQ